jgi:hypothetical protein
MLVDDRADDVDAIRDHRHDGRDADVAVGTTSSATFALLEHVDAGFG